MRRLFPTLATSLLLLSTAEAERFQWHGNSKLVKVEYVKHRWPFVLYDTEKAWASVTNLTAQTRTFDVSIRLTDLARPDFRQIGSRSDKITLAPRQAKEIVVDVPGERAKPYGLFEAIVELAQDGEQLNFAVTTYGYSVRPAKVSMAARSPFATWLCSRGWINEEGEPEIFGSTDFDHFKVIGINNSRGICAGWSYVEREKGTFDFRLPDRFVEHLHRSGVGATGILMGPPKWASRTPVITAEELRRRRSIPEGNKKLFSIRERSHYANAMPKDLDDWSNYVYRTVKHFKGRVNEWIVWNEPYFGFLTIYDPKTGKDMGVPPRARAYYELVRSAYIAAKTANRDCVIAVEAGYPGWASRLFAIGNGDIVKYADVFVRHLYFQHCPDYEEMFKDVAFVKELIRKSGGKQALWDTETGRTAARRKTNRPMHPDALTKLLAEMNASGKRLPGYFWMRNAVDEWAHADFYVREMITKLGLGIERIYDWVNGAPTYTLRRDYPTLTTLAATRLIGLLHGGEVVRRLPNGNQDVFVWLIRRADGKHVLACWRRNRKAETRENVHILNRDFTVTSPVDIAIGNGKSVAIYDIFGNRLRRERANRDGFINLDLNSAPVYVEDIPKDVNVLPERVHVSCPPMILKETESSLRVTVSNPFSKPLHGSLSIVYPADWKLPNTEKGIVLEANSQSDHDFRFKVPAAARSGTGEVKAALDRESSVAEVRVKELQTAKYMSPAPAIDGNVSEWRKVKPVAIDRRSQVNMGIVKSVETFVPENMMAEDQWRGPDDLSGAVSAAWNEGDLYLLFQVRDQEILNRRRYKTPYRGDAVEFFAKIDEFGPGKIFQLIVVPPDREVSETTFRLFQGFKELSGFRVKSSKTKDGYVVEAAIPWKNLGDLKPRPGMALRVDYSLNDADSDHREGIKAKSKISWQGQGKTYMTTDNYGCLILAGN